MGDIWYLAEGGWMVYVDDLQVAVDFSSIPAMKRVTTYYQPGGKKKAIQFWFTQGRDPQPGKCLLHYVCRQLQLDFARVLDLARTPGVPYGERYGKTSYQPEMIQLCEIFEPDRKKLKGAKRTKAPGR